MSKILLALVMVLVAIPAMAQGAGWIGVQVDDQKDRGAIVRRVEPNSPAEKAGLKEGDVILEFNKEQVIGVQQLTRLVRETPVGRTVDVKVHRDNRDETFKVTADKSSAAVRLQGLQGFDFNLPDVQVFTREFSNNFSKNFPLIEMNTVHVQSGARVEQISDQLRDFFGVFGANGVLVTSVERGSAAEKAGLKAADVITNVDGKDIRTPDEFSRAMRAASKPSVKVIRDKKEVELRFE
jgi:serine protease Do